jgi:carboxypeptidase C (cathepsin A)
MFIDNPVGVGFSYAARDVDIKNNDISYRRDILKFMLTFYQYAPALASNPLYIYGISYGGVFAPTLAYAIHLHN